MENRGQQLKEVFPSIKEKVLLRDFSTFRIGGIADYILETGDSSEVIKAISFCRESDIAFCVIGGGSNILIADDGFRGLVIAYKSQFGKTNLLIEDEKIREIFLDASLSLGEVVMKVSASGYTGLEWAAGIPGTIGGAINGNAGAFGGTISDNLKEVKVFSLKENREKLMSCEECCFGYRVSVFKNTFDYLILGGLFRFNKDLKETISDRIKENLKKRGGKQPKAFSAGSVFTNYEGGVDKKLFKKYPELENYVDNGIVPAGYLIDKCNLKGMKMGDAQIDSGNANFIVNNGEAKAENVVKLISIAKKAVKERFGITLKEEIKYIGRF